MVVYKNIQDHYRATLVGCAVGDTLGMAVEGWPPGRIASVGGVHAPMAPVILKNTDGARKTEDEWGPIKFWTENLYRGEVTDDTILTMAVARALMKAGYDVDACGKEHLAAYNACRQADGKVRGAFGKTTLSALERLSYDIPPAESGIMGGPGNGPPMKMAPVGIAMWAANSCSTPLEYAAAVSRITHHDPRSIAAGVLQAYNINSVLNNITKKMFLTCAISVCEEYERPVTKECASPRDGSLLDRLRWIKASANATEEDARICLGTSSKAYQSLPFSMFMFMKYWDEPIKGLLAVVNAGGDCDSTGAMFGALAGARHGMVFPQEWVDVLRMNDRPIKDELTQLADGIAERMQRT